MTTETNKPTDNTQALAIRAKEQAIAKFNPERISIEAAALRALYPKSLGRIKDGRQVFSDEQLRALVIASLSSGLRVERGEIYLTDYGVAVAAKVKAADAIAEQGRLGNSLAINYEQVTPEMTRAEGSIYRQYAGAVEPGDVAIACRIVSSKARRDYYSMCVEITRYGRELGYRGVELENFVKAQAGAIPETIALGVVKAKENFGGDEKYPRAERARKRATTLALNIGGWHAMDRRNYGGVKLHDEVDASEDTVEGDYTISAPEPFSAGVSGMSESEPEPLEPVSDDNRLKLSQLLDTLPAAKSEHARAGKTPEEKDKFKSAIIKMLELVNIQLKARGMEPVSAKSTDEAMPLISRALEIMREYDERAPRMEHAPA